MNISDIQSIGWLNNADNSVALTICIRNQSQPVFVSISKAELENAGGIENINNNKQLAVNFFNLYGAGRQYKGRQT